MVTSVQVLGAKSVVKVKGRAGEKIPFRLNVAEPAGLKSQVINVPSHKSICPHIVTQHANSTCGEGAGLSAPKASDCANN
jgi:hypothetical protein